METHSKPWDVSYCQTKPDGRLCENIRKITSVTQAIYSYLEDVEKQGKIQTTRHIAFNSSG